MDRAHKGTYMAIGLSLVEFDANDSLTQITVWTSFGSLPCAMVMWV